MKKTLFLMGMLLPLFSYCQSLDSSSMHKELPTPAPLLGGVTITNSMALLNPGNSSFTMQQPIVDVGFPVYKDFSAAHPVLIKTGIRYQGLFLSDGQNIGNNPFHSLAVPLLINYSLSGSTNIAFVSLATVGSDFDRSISATDIQYTVGVRIGFGSGSSFKHGITLAYISNYSGKFLLPVPDIDWAISNKLSLAGIIPLRVSLKYKLSEVGSVGITASLDGSMYHMNSGPKDQYLHLQQNSTGFIYDIQLSRRWKLNLIASHTFSQRLETFNMDQKVSFDGFTKLKDRIANISYRQNSFIFQGGIGYGF